MNNLKLEFIEKCKLCSGSVLNFNKYNSKILTIHQENWDNQKTITADDPFKGCVNS